MTRLLRLAVAIAAAWLSAATGAAQFSLVSVEQEIEIGREANAQVRKETPEVRDAQATAYVRAMGGRMARQAAGPAYPYSFALADYRDINAFALPGGPVWINRGVLHAATTESQVAGVLAHEVAHIAQRHAASQLTKGLVANLGLGLLGAVLGNGGGAGTAQAAAGLLTNGIFLKFSRDDEREADRVGLQLMRRAGWDARGMVELFEILQREQARNPGSVETFFSSHPSPQDRIERLRDEVARQRGGTRDTPQFQAVKARLLRMPPPKPMPHN
ncbi:MAG: M48 family metalloprotease [Acidobacteria bacterium]|nr:M48 family metalloprotease [Acidobacteriota bacterium]